MARKAPASKSDSTLDRRRLTWVLFSLVASMTLGAWLLNQLEPNHKALAQVTSLAASYGQQFPSDVTNPDQPVRPGTWNSLTFCPVQPSLIAGDQWHTWAHFVIDAQGKVHVGTGWKQQIKLQGGSGSIIVAIADVRPITSKQIETRELLRRCLQARCRILDGNISSK